jgi:hypothetical protein
MATGGYSLGRLSSPSARVLGNRAIWSCVRPIVTDEKAHEPFRLSHIGVDGSLLLARCAQLGFVSFEF